MTRCAVYDLLVDETVVYVGSTVNPKQRCFEHRCREEFKAARLRIYAWYGSVLRAQISESDRIAALRPHYNIACNPDVLVSRHNERKAAIIKEWERDLGSGVPAKDANRKCECRLKHLARRKGATVAQVADACGVSTNKENIMAEQTEISWADATFNPWIGCTKVSPACDHCYAARDNERRGWVDGWGAGVPRRRTKTWQDPARWDRKAQQTGYRPRVFCASLADVFDNEVPDEWRTDLWALLRATPNLRWMLVTKRIGNATKMVPMDWPMSHVGLISTIVTQDEWDRDWPKLSRTPAAWRGISAEPLLGPINIGDARPDWIITGGESGPAHRTTNPDWVRSIRDQCAANGVAFHHKQWGGVRPKQNGCLVDGVEHKHFPPQLAA